VNAIEDLLEKSKKTAEMWRRKAEEEEDFGRLLSLLIPHLPKDLPYSDATSHSAYAEGCVELIVDRLEDVKSVALRLPPVEAVMVKDGCTSAPTSAGAGDAPV
jgi:hypothetical protein